MDFEWMPFAKFSETKLYFDKVNFNIYTKIFGYLENNLAFAFLFIITITYVQVSWCSKFGLLRFPNYLFENNLKLVPFSY